MQKSLRIGAAKAAHRFTSEYSILDTKPPLEVLGIGQLTGRTGWLRIHPTTGRLRWVGHYILSPESLDCMTGDPKATSAVPEKELLELTQYTVFDLYLFLWVNHLFTFLKLREIKSRTLQELL